jgi:type IV pilus assembly protein PilB
VPEVIKRLIELKYGAQVGTEVKKALVDVGENVVDLSDGSKLQDLQSDIASAPVAKIVNTMLEYAAKVKASDIHIEPRETKLVVRNRVNGVLSEKLILPLQLAPSIVSRIKILSNLKIDEHRIPQDGRFQIKYEGNYIDLRISIIPAVYGEKVVIRLLEKGSGSLSLEETGLRGLNLEIFSKNIKTTGIILVTGPTGSKQ